MNKIEVAWNVYNNVVFTYAEERFNAVIKPWLIQHNYTFLAGNGTFYIFGKSGDINLEDLPKYIYNILCLDIPGFDQPLGSLMPNWEYKS